MSGERTFARSSLHEFVPHDLKGQEEMAKAMNVTVEYIRQRVESLCEHNPMLGHRGCRLGNTYPEITEMQTRAILGAACELKKKVTIHIQKSWFH